MQAVLGDDWTTIACQAIIDFAKQFENSHGGDRKSSPHFEDLTKTSEKIAPQRSAPTRRRLAI